VDKLSFESISIDNAGRYFNNDINVDVLRLDKISDIVSGNKWFKLRFHLEAARDAGNKTILTFGGAWSNHILATASICQAQGFASIGIIRGERPARFSPTLIAAQERGMQLVFISRSEYAEKIIPEPYTREDIYVINEGGFGETGAKGATTILEYSHPLHTHICCAVGTGTMMAGLINGCEVNQKVIGIPVLKNHPELGPMIQSLLERTEKQWTLADAFHFGGYAKYNDELIAFMNDFYDHTAIPSDFVYTGKLFYAVKQLANAHFFPKQSQILIIHSGGLQGNQSLPAGTLIF
jgi:1-aminocyclopropane-1-carboxylate deaminase